MKVALLLTAVAALGAGMWSQGGDPGEVVILIGGDTHGYLAPCGCTKPMSGGLRRRASAAKSLTAGKRSLLIENGGLIHGLGRQDEIKAETIAESLRVMGCDAINLTSREAAIGRGVVETIARLSRAPFVTGSIANESKLPVTPLVEQHGVAIGGLSTKSEAIARDLGDRAEPLAEAAEALVVRAASKPLILLLEGTETDARLLAASNPGIKLVVYNSIGDPPTEPIRVGDQLLVTLGEKGKSLIRLTLSRGRIDGYTVVKLGPDYPDDRKVAEIYDRYLSRVKNEKLLERMPRAKGPRFAGNPTCGTCHIDAMLKWELTRHASALHTLELEKHDRDPDCVGCHVVGLSNEYGFKSREETSHLTDVGCESCHGAGGDHATDPNKFPMPKVGEASCNACHDRANSPNFDFAKYWDKVKH